MFEREIQFIYDFSHNEIKKLGSFITFNELKSTNLHPAILQYISAEIDFYIFEDRQKLLKDSLFDYSGNKINSYFLQISDEIKKVKKFSQSYIEKLILHSVTFTVNHLVSPNSLISQFIFEEDKEKSAAEIKQILNYLYYYPHINKIISSYLDKKNLMKIDSEEFEILLKKIDRISLETNSDKIYNEALESMAEFFNIGMSGRVLVPMVAVQNFLKDKGLNIHLEKLQSEFIDAEVTRYEIKDYQKVLIGFDAGELNPVKEAVTEEVLESDLVNETLHSNSFEPVEEEEQIIEKEDSSVDIKIMEDESHKVILDEEPITEIEDDLEEQIESVPEEIKDEQVSEENEDSEDIIDEERISENTTPEKDLSEIPGEEDEVILDNSPEVDSEIIEIEDERELENEAVAEVMELAKEEVEITTEDEIEGEEIIADKEMDESLEVIEESVKQSDTIAIDSDGAEEGEENLNIIDDEEKPVEFEEETIAGEEDKNPEIDDNLKQDEELDKESEEELVEEVQDKYNMEKIEPIISDDIAEEVENEDLSESNTEAVDTLSHLLDEDSVEIKMGEEDAEDEELNEVDEETESDEKLALFEEGEEKEAEEEEGEISLEADKKEVVEEETADSAVSHLDITSLLKNKKMSKIIDVIFDYDMEEFANAIEQIGEAPNIDSAIRIIDKVCRTSQISVSSKEAKLFKSIISDYYRK